MATSLFHIFCCIFIFQYNICNNIVKLMCFFDFQWLWASIQMEARADEWMYLFEEETENSRSSSRNSSCRKTPSSATLSAKSRSHRRKRLRENLAKLAHEGQGDTPLVKTRRSSYSNACQPLSTSQLDNTATESSATVAGKLSSIILCFCDADVCWYRLRPAVR